MKAREYLEACPRVILIVHRGFLKFLVVSLELMSELCVIISSQTGSNLEGFA